MEYIFFDEALQRRFLEYLTAAGLRAEARTDRMGGHVVELQDEPGEQESAIEAEYELLMEEQFELVQSTDDGGSSRMEVAVTLADGSRRSVRLPTAFARRFLEHFSIEELQDFVSGIAQSLANPVEGPLCRKPGER